MVEKTKKVAKKTTKKKAAPKKYDPFGIDRPMSASSAVRILEDIELWKYEKENPKPDTKATAFGSALHCLLLEPEKFDDNFIIATGAPINPRYGTPFKRGSKSYDEWFETVKLQAGKKKLIFPEEYQELLIMQKEYKHLVDDLVNIKGYKLNRERPIEWIDEETKQPCTGFIDTEIAGIILDLKTTADMSEDTLYKKCQKSYFIQAAVYADALRQIDDCQHPIVFLVFLRSKAPYTMKIVEVEKETLELGLKEFRKAIRIYQDCAKKKSFKISRTPTKWGYKPWKIREIEGV